jgi:hypothetical protein
MKLIRFDDDKTGLVVELPSGPHVIDVVASIGALVPEDPISHGVLNGPLKEKGNWAPLIQHWKMARAGLRRLAFLAQTAGSSQVVLRRHHEIRDSSIHYPGGIVSLDIAECDVVRSDPTGREVMERQFTGSSLNPTGQNTVSNSREEQWTDDRIIVLHPFQHSQLSFSTPEQQAKFTTEPMVSASRCTSPSSNIS